MPLLSHRRSMLDLLTPRSTDPSQQEPHNRPSTAGLPLFTPPAEPSTRPRSEYGFPTSRLSREVLRHEISDQSASIIDEHTGGRHKRFSILKLRNFSEPQLAVRAAKESTHAERAQVPPLPAFDRDGMLGVCGVSGGAPAYIKSAAPATASAAAAATPPAPTIVRTAPTNEVAHQSAHQRKQRHIAFRRSPSKNHVNQTSGQAQSAGKGAEKRKSTAIAWRRLHGKSTGLDDLAHLSSARASRLAPTPPANPDFHDPFLAIPSSRPSVSSQSDLSDHASAHSASRSGSGGRPSLFSKLGRRNKNRNSLFPLPVRIPPPDQHQRQHSGESQTTIGTSSSPVTPRASTGAFSNHSVQTPDSRTPNALYRRHTETSPAKRRGSHSPLPTAGTQLAQGPLFGHEQALGLFRGDSQRSRASSTSSPLQPPMRLGARDRASTTSSYGRVSHDSPQPWTGSGRTSTSTTGRSSLGGLLNLARFRQSSDPHSPRHGSPGTGSKSNSFAISREALVVPDREDGEAPGKYLERLEAAISRSSIAGVLSKSADGFAQAVLRSYCRRFAFFGEPIDMSLRKFLLEAELPKETQQIDRVVQSFADRYHECNPGIFVDPSQAYLIAFSLMMLHTDAFNKSNKRKMTKPDYVRNTSGQGVNDDILACFYDNICYTPFVHFEEDVDLNGTTPFGTLKQQKKRRLKDTTVENGKKPTGPLDPYNLLVEQKLDTLRPSLKDSISMDDPYNYIGSQGGLDAQYLQRAFTHTGTLQIISARSRPTAYSEGQMAMNAGMMSTPLNTFQDAQGQAGVIDIKVTKVGTLWRKATKRKKTRSPWQEWGAILTGSQLYLFKNVHWTKGLTHQFLSAQKHGHHRQPVVFKPPLTEFRPDEIFKIDDAVALIDKSYTRHKHAFDFVRPQGQEEVLLADNESELNDWLGLINHAAAFQAAGVRIRGMTGGADDALKAADLKRLESANSVHTQRITDGEAALAIQHRRMDSHLHRQIMAGRRQILLQKIGEAEQQLADLKLKLDDLLRNARHLQILAPIAPRTREDVVYAAGTADARLKWTRRDIWRTKCHKDMLILDVQQDGVVSPDPNLQPEHEVESPDSGKKVKTKGLSRMRSNASTAKSPPQSPRSSRSTKSPLTRGPSLVLRPSTADSEGAFMGDDVFRTPPETATVPRSSEPWRLPPLDFDVDSTQAEEKEHRGSVASTLLSINSFSPHQGTSVSNASTSSVQQTPSALEAKQDPLVGRVTPTPSIDAHDLRLLVSNGLATEHSRPTSSGIELDGMSAELSAKTPDSRHKAGVRRSLQKTLRDAQHHGSMHKHRRGKESEGAVRSGADVLGGDDNEGTPGLERAKGRFILHGKQASVVQFGPEWPNERMKARREQWQWRTTSSRQGTQDSQNTTFSGASQVTDPSSHTTIRTHSVSSGSHLDPSHRSQSFGENGSVTEDQPAAASPSAVSSLHSFEDVSSEILPASEIDSSDQKPNKNRLTVIGPQSRPSTEQLRKSETSEDGIGTIFLKERRDSDFDKRDHRRTVIGPPALQINGYTRGTTTNDDADDDHSEQGGLKVSPIEDDELRRLSTPSPVQAVRVA